jgi:NAD(P)-dependent dehydrogenase (short-subunit alcohol dehydrogenase family)
MVGKQIAISGSQSGMGLAFRRLLETSGYTIIGIDLPGKGAEVEGDLSNQADRKRVVNEIVKCCNGKLDGLIANAGVDQLDARLVFELNYFGVIDLLEGLQPALAAAEAGSRVVITASNSVVITPNILEQPVTYLNNRNLESALESLGNANHFAYQVSKLALVRWLRNNAGKRIWAGNGITMNAIAPGAVLTPLLERDLSDPIKGPMIEALPKPLGSFAKPEDIAGLVKFLMSEDARFIIGQMIIIDGGMEVIWREKDWPSVWNITTDAFMAKMNATPS